MSFKLNPIRVVNDGKIVRIVESTKDFKIGNVTKINIVTLSDVPIHSYDITDDLFIELDLRIRLYHQYFNIFSQSGLLSDLFFYSNSFILICKA